MLLAIEDMAREGACGKFAPPVCIYIHNTVTQMRMD